MSLSVRPTLSVFWRHVRRYPFLVTFLLASLVVLYILELAIPLLSKRFFDVVSSGLTGEAMAEALLGVLVLMLGVAVLRWAAFRCASLTNNYFQPRVIADLEQYAFSHVLNHSYRFFSNNFAGALVRKIHRLGRSFETIADQIEWRLLSLVIAIIGTVVIFFLRSPIVAFALVLWVAVFIAVNIVIATWKLKYDTERAQLDTESGAVLSDAISNSMTIQQFVGRNDEIARFRDVNERWRRMMTFTWHLGDINEAVQSGLMIVLEGIIMYFAIQFYAAGKLTVGDFALIQTALVGLFAKLWDFGRVIRHSYEGFADAKEMVEILETPHEVRDKPTAKKLKVKAGAIEFRDVSFSYNMTRPVLRNLTLLIAPREKIAFVGPSGAGKSTVIKLLMRFFDVTSGKVLIDGQKIADATQDSLRANVSLVPQDPLLFHRTIMENIRYGRRAASDKEVIAASKKAHCHEFIMNLPNGYDTMVGERGIKLSGGERQRVAIARAILKNAPILILDEATSSLDSESEAMIQDALKSLMKDKTVIVIAHRLSTIMQMDRIVVIEQGAVTDTGTHHELLARAGTYKKLWSIQAGGFLPDSVKKN